MDMHEWIHGKARQLSKRSGCSLRGSGATCGLTNGTRKELLPTSAPAFVELSDGTGRAPSAIFLLLSHRRRPGAGHQVLQGGNPGILAATIYPPLRLSLQIYGVLRNYIILATSTKQGASLYLDSRTEVLEPTCGFLITPIINF